MKTKTLTITTGIVHDPTLEEMMQKQDAFSKESARRNAKHFAKRNLPLPKGDRLSNYIGEMKAEYEKLASTVTQYLKVASLFPEAKIINDQLEEQMASLVNEISEKQMQNQNDERELGDHNLSVPWRIRLVTIASAVITIGEVVYNTKAFQVTGENMLFALILSMCISFTVFLFSHIAPFIYKEARNKKQRILTVVFTLAVALSIFTVLAFLRTTYLESHGVHINPVAFIIFNMAFFIVSALLSLFIMPSWPEIKTNYGIMIRNRQIKKLTKEYNKVKQRQVELKTFCISIAGAHNYAMEQIRKMYAECVETFKMTNLTFRTDKSAPECYSEPIPEADIEDFSYANQANKTNTEEA